MRVIRDYIEDSNSSQPDPVESVHVCTRTTSATAADVPILPSQYNPTRIQPPQSHSRTMYSFNSISNLCDVAPQQSLGNGRGRFPTGVHGHHFGIQVFFFERYRVWVEIVYQHQSCFCISNTRSSHSPKLGPTRTIVVEILCGECFP